MNLKMPTPPTGYQWELVPDRLSTGKEIVWIYLVGPNGRREESSAVLASFGPWEESIPRRARLALATFKEKSRNTTSAYDFVRNTNLVY